MRVIKILPCISLCILTLSLKAQDPVFSQTMATPMYFNPAFAGFQQNFRGGLQWRNQFADQTASLFASADMGLPKINSGVGLMLSNYVLGDDVNTLHTETISALYAYEFKLGTAGYLRLGVGWLFTLQMAGKVGIAGPGGYPPPDQEPIAQSPNLASGVLFYTGCFYAGLALNNIIMPNMDNYSSNSGYLPTYRRFDFQAGGFIKLNKFSLNPNILYWRQGDYTQILPGINLSYSMFTVGASYRYAFEHVSSINYLIGFAWDKFKLCYSYDHSLSGAIYPGYSYYNPTAGSHELSLVIQFSKPHDTANKPMVDHFRSAF